MSNWHIDVLMTPIRTIDIGHIRDEDNEATPNRGPRVEVQLLGENLADTVERSHGDDQDTSEPTDTTPIESIPNTSRASSSHRSTPSSTVVVIARV